jgi:hypothetical protein
MRKNLLISLAIVLLVASVSAQGGKKVSSGPCVASKANAETINIFPVDNPWNKVISREPIDPFSNEIIAAFVSSVVRTDFGSVSGLPYTVVCSNQPKLNITFTDNADQSDAGYSHNNNY